jgi:hypothetical protein
MLLASDLTSQLNHRFHPHTLSSSSSPTKQSQTFYRKLAQSAATANPNFNTSRYYQSVPRFESPASSELLDDPYMSTSNYNYQSPAIRIQQSTPTPGFQQSNAQNLQQQQNQQSFEGNAYAQSWGAFGSNEGMVATTQNLQTPGLTGNRSHQRHQSSSSIGSSGSASPFSQSHGQQYSYAVSSDGSPTVHTASKLGQQYNVDQSSRSFSNHLPTPTQTPTSDSFLASNYASYNQQGQINSTVAATLAMNNAIDHISNNEEEIPGMSHSARQSVSSLGQEPSTPRTVSGDVYEEGFPQASHGEIHPLQEVELWLDEYLQYDETDIVQRAVPKFDRTMSEIYQEAGYNPNVSALQTQVNPARLATSNQYLSPARNVINERLQAAQVARSHSPTSAGSRGVSPFRPDSPYVHDPYARFHTAAQLRQLQKQQADAQELSQHQQQTDSAPKTISPKEALLDYSETEEDAKNPLFPETSQSDFTQQLQYSAGQQRNYQAQGQFDNSNAAQTAFANIGVNASRAEQWTNPRRQGAAPYTATSQQQPSYNFSSTPIQTGTSILPFSSQNYRSTSSAMPTTKSEETPDFPAHLTSMESSASEAPQSTQNSQNSTHTQETQKPVSSLADTGTYTCTYHGCTLRFETPQKLQKHKREGHRNPAASLSPASPAAAAASSASASSMTSAAILARNSQAGPHKCERINPTTGKPCNTIFSRPYDLTRHEDTIHNARKQKVRCALCVEEKTFSRNDALTRHMRVVHPEVDFPGKHRRRGAHD